MSLTNPNTPVSQQDLQDFYHKLLPYIGGSFGLVATGIDSANLYSTTERVVGQWIDGKPLYQKTIDCGAIPNNSTKVIQHNIANIDTITNFDIIGITSGKISIKIPGEVTTANHTSAIGCYVSRNDIGFKSYDDRSGYNAYAIIQYTKTTDSAVESYGTDTTYSTDEHVVGSWIDGRPVYQKVLSFTDLPVTADGGTRYTRTVTTLSNVDLVLDYSIIASGIDSGVKTILGTAVDSSRTIQKSSYAYISTSTNRAAIMINTDHSCTVSGYVMIKYVKPVSS